MGFPNPPQSQNIQPPMVYVNKDPAWEYQVVVRNLVQEKALEAAELNELGADGWELAGVFSDSPFVYFYFKRLTH
jgi:hypothetical protein